jgi:CRISPR-associated endonuclease/helicase Cas3
VRGYPTDFWGKLRRDDKTGEVCDWHPLIDHCADVAAVTEALLNLPLWRQRLRAFAARELDETCIARLCVLAALHDVGKFNVGFQAKSLGNDTVGRGHIREALGALFQRPGPFACLDELGAFWGDGTTELLVAALCHHGRPYDVNSADIAAMWQASWWRPQGQLHPKEGVEALLARCRSWFPLAFEPADVRLPTGEAFSHAFAGVVMLADWIGSDTRFFEYDRTDADRMEFARRQARTALRKVALDFPIADRADAEGRTPFRRIAQAEYHPTAVQSAMAALPRDQQGSISVLEAETGSGKTEAVLSRFVSLFEAGLVDGLYFALPTRSAATQMHRRVHDAAQRAFKDPPAVILAVPGYLKVDDATGERLPPFDVQWPDHDRFRYRAWAAETSKRYLAGCIAVGTIDQVLLSSLMVRHAHLRAASLLRHLLVVDEVHASDAYMTAILEHVLARHLLAGGHAVLLSATLGGEIRARLLNPSGAPHSLHFEDACRTPYPFISHRGQVETLQPLSVANPQREIELNVRPWLDNPRSIAHAALEAARTGAKVLVIRNTVTDCVKTHLAVEAAADAIGAHHVLFTCRGYSAPHHARFARVDRQALDSALEASLGKAREPGGCIVVATQTVQQSLDLDADLLFSDLCPADVLLQRLGRLHRHQRNRLSAFAKPAAFVIVPEGRDLGALIGGRGAPKNYHGLGSVYADLRVLEATWRLVETRPTWVLPRMNREIVEGAVHSSRLEAITREGGECWRQHANYVIGVTRGHRRVADLNLVDWGRSYAETSFPSADDRRIQTRLGEGDRRVVFTPSIAGPFGEPVDEVTLPAWLAAAAPEDAQPERVQTVGNRTSFHFGGRAFVYDRYGLRSHTAPVLEPEQDDGP